MRVLQLMVKLDTDEQPLVCFMTQIPPCLKHHTCSFSQQWLLLQITDIRITEQSLLMIHEGALLVHWKEEYQATKNAIRENNQTRGNWRNRVSQLLSYIAVMWLESALPDISAPYTVSRDTAWGGTYSRIQQRAKGAMPNHNILSTSGMPIKILRKTNSEGPN